MENVDVHKNGKINYSEFIAATISIQEFLTEEKLWMIFRHFDVDDTDYISRENIVEAMKKMGKELTEQEVDEALNLHDITKNQKISFEEFRHMFFPKESFGDATKLEHKDIEAIQKKIEAEQDDDIDDLHDHFLGKEDEFGYKDASMSNLDERKS